MSDHDRARQLFLDANLAFPAIPESLAANLIERAEWVYSTRDLEMSPYNLQDFVDEYGRSPVEDFAVLSHSGHGVNSYAIQYYLAYGRLRLFLHLGWGGVYMNAEEAAAQIRTCFELADLIVAAELPFAKRRDSRYLTIVGSDFYGSYWLPPNSSEQLSSIRTRERTLLRPEEVLNEVRESQVVRDRQHEEIRARSRVRRSGLEKYIQMQTGKLPEEWEGEFNTIFKLFGENWAENPDYLREKERIDSESGYLDELMQLRRAVDQRGRRDLPRRTRRMVENVVTNQEPGKWLEAVFVEAQNANWCTSPGCTTCGCLDFRRAYWAAAARQAGVDGRFEAAAIPGEILAGVSSANRSVMFHTLIAGLRELPPMLTESGAFKIIIFDLDHAFLQHGVSVVLNEALSGTPAGEALRQMRAHAAEREARRQARSTFESREAAEEREQVRRAENAEEHARRLQAQRQRHLERSESVQHLAQLSPTDRLTQFATDPNLNLDSVPDELIPVDSASVLELDKSVASKLLEKIGRRRGKWGLHRRMLESRLSEESE